MRAGGVLNMELMKPTEVTPEPYKRVVARVTHTPDASRTNSHTNSHLSFSFHDSEVYMDGDGRWWHSNTEPVTGRVVWWKPSW